MKTLNRRLRRLFPGVSWRNPVGRLLFRLIDPVDYLVRFKNGLTHLPPYSRRVRSNGIGGQFGGERFAREGKYLVDMLRRHANVGASSGLLEIGCGCGRTAVQLVEVLDTGKYYGVDVDRVSIAACKENGLFEGRPFQFELMDIYNGVYNPDGKLKAESYKFPFPDNSFDVVYMYSVFTHILPREIENYVREGSRMLKREGIFLFSAFLMDYGTEGNTISFPHRAGESYLLSRDIPEKAVGYELQYLDDVLLPQGLRRQREPLYGQWRKTKVIEADTDFSQDILVYSCIEKLSSP